MGLKLFKPPFMIFALVAPGNETPVSRPNKFAGNTTPERWKLLGRTGISEGFDEAFSDYLGMFMVFKKEKKSEFCKT